jgi:hypothetical protein
VDSQIDTPPLAPSKRCTKCCATKSILAFPPKRNGIHGVGAWCRECKSVQARERYAMKKVAQNMHAEVLTATTKTCTCCGDEKEFAFFRTSKRGRNGLHSQCRDCVNAKWRDRYAWAKANGDKVKSYQRRHYHGMTPEKRRDAHLKSVYGISLARYREMLAAQGGKCAICGSTDPKSRTGDFHVDHSHATGAVRGLLCNLCNVGLGSLQDSPTVARSAAAYLEKYAAGEVS